MRSACIYGALLACTLVAIVTGAPEIKEDELQNMVSSDQSQVELIVQDKVVPSRLLNFRAYMEMFHKRYPSLIQFVARQRLFLKRVFQCFLSLIAFRNKESPIYLSTNEMSDWTDTEIDSVYIPVAKFKEKYNRPVVAQSLQSSTESRAAKRSRRAKRSVGYQMDRAKRKSPRDIKLDDLMVDPRVLQAETQRGTRVPSNNPMYQAPDVISYGDENDDDEPTQPLAEDEAKNIVTSDTGFFSNLVGAYKTTANRLQVLATSYGLVDYNHDYYDDDDDAESDHDYHQLENLPDEIFEDHSSCFLSPKSQSTCGSCYIFATLALFEWQYCRETGQKVSFSEQFPLDCGERIGMKGCDGGFIEEVINYSKLFGLELSSNYPYRRQEDTCPYARSTSPLYTGYMKMYEADFEQIPMNREDLVEEALGQGPLAIGIMTGTQFSFYGGGVDDGGDCSERGHAMVLVGHGREDGKEYWLIRNSHGLAWGVAGYYKLSKDFNCWAAPAHRLHGTFSDSDKHINSYYDPGPIKKRRLDHFLADSFR